MKWLSGGVNDNHDKLACHSIHLHYETESKRNLHFHWRESGLTGQYQQNG